MNNLIIMYNYLLFLFFDSVFLLLLFILINKKIKYPTTHQ